MPFLYISIGFIVGLVVNLAIDMARAIRRPHPDSLEYLQDGPRSPEEVDQLMSHWHGLIGCSLDGHGRPGAVLDGFSVHALDTTGQAEMVTFTVGQQGGE